MKQPMATQFAPTRTMHALASCWAADALTGRRSAIFSVAAVMSCVMQVAYAAPSCPGTGSGSSTTCTLESGSATANTSEIVDFTGSTGKDDNAGGAGGNYTFNNNSAVLSGTGAAGMFVRMRGGSGSTDGSSGGQGGIVTIDNRASFTNLSTPSSDAIGGAGVWDDTGTRYGIYGASVGGGGGSRSSSVFGGGDGGRGGNGSTVNITNSGSVALRALRFGGAGIYGASIGGNGGNQDKGAIGNQVGGNGGAGSDVVVMNTGSIDVSDDQAKKFAWGLAAESRGGLGGENNGSGGVASSTVSITNSGPIELNIKGSSFSDGVRGIYAGTLGGDGRTSEDGDDYGGAGGNYAGLTVVSSGAVTVEATGVSKPTTAGSLSGGVVVIAQGGTGGDGPNTVTNISGERAGTGGAPYSSANVTLQSGSLITTKGDYLPGVNILAVGGQGGAGRGQSNGAGGGNGADVFFSQDNGAKIDTAGTQSHGVAVRSYGGAGGGVRPSSGLVDFTAENAGTGGVGGAVEVTNSGQINTTGTYSKGILAQSQGGIGGTSGDSFEFFGNAGADAGKGGLPRSVKIINSGAISTAGESSHGIHAQSIGGGGGSAGASGGIVAVGSGGGTAVNGASASISNSAQVTTRGDASIGAISQSIGGGGGDGGNGTGVIAIGGSGAGGGDGGTSTVEMNGATINTVGNVAYGSVAQSIGGGGGIGGSSLAINAGVAISFTVAVGGSGGSGGTAGVSSMTLTGSNIQTGVASNTSQGDDSHGFIVQSLGGGGGVGGNSTAKTFALAPPGDVFPSATVGISVGGNGGGGGNGGNAGASISESQIVTYGNHAAAAVVQSLGGGGGIGGSASAMSAVIGLVSSNAASLNVALGGVGGTGGNASLVTLSVQNTSLETFGENSNAVVAQGIGGGGGMSGFGMAQGATLAAANSLDFSVGVGGVGGTGGLGADIAFSTDDDVRITTHGDGSRGVLVQSIGGGGGTAQGGNVSLVAGKGVAGPKKVTGNTKIGADGGTGGRSGTVALNLHGTIDTYGAGADGVLVQAIGGGGGLGGSAGGKTTGVPKTLLDDVTTVYSMTSQLGGNGGSGADGGAIGSFSSPAILAAKIQTRGDHSNAAVLQSIGAGGGVGGSASASSSQSFISSDYSVGGVGGASGTGYEVNTRLDANNGNLFSTQGYGSSGLIIQSIGGGGGIAASGIPQGTGTLSVGGQSGTASSANPIAITSGSYGTFSTTGESAYGILAQAIGGGGGLAIVGDRDSSAAKSLTYDLLVGGYDSVGNGDAVSIASGLNLTTNGDRSPGVIAQSIGAGGGIATAGVGDNIKTMRLGAARPNATQSVGRAVTLTLSDKIRTYGAGSSGVIAQSIGGGGGIVGDLAQPWASGNVQTGGPQGVGSGGTVSVSFDGTLITSGKYAHGIVAQSIGGGGGILGSRSGGFAGSSGFGEASGSSDSVTVTQSGTLSASGDGSFGVYGQSAGVTNQGRGAVTVNVNGTVVGGTGTGAGVKIVQGHNSAVNIASTGAVSALSGTAVVYDSGLMTDSSSTLAVNNRGSLIGDVLCVNGSGACSVNNLDGGVASAATNYQAAVFNDGTMFIGTPGRAQTLTVAGPFTQSKRGKLVADVDFSARRASNLVVEQDALFDGTISASPITLLPDRELDVVTVMGRTAGTLTAEDSPVIDYETRQTGQRITLRAAGADFASKALALEGNERAVAEHVQKGWDSGGGEALAPLYAQLDLASRQGVGNYRSSLASLSPGATLAPAAQAAASVAQFTGAMLSCPAFGESGSFIREQDCFWGQFTRRTTDQDAGRSAPGFTYDASLYQFGGQREIKPGWFVGGSFAYEDSSLRGKDSRVRGDGQSGYAGAVVKRQTGAWVLSATLGAGYSSYDLKRNVDIRSFGQSVDSKPDVFGANAKLRAARYFETSSNTYLKPYVDFDTNYTRMSSYKESGNNPLALDVRSKDQVVFGLSPMLEFGGRLTVKNAMTVRPFAYVGATFLSRDQWSSSAKLRGAPQGSGTFETSLPVDDVTARVGAGLQVFKVGKVDVKVQYDGRFSKHTTSHAGMLTVAVPF